MLTSSIPNYNSILASGSGDGDWNREVPKLELKLYCINYYGKVDDDIVLNIFATKTNTV